jgi:hypothetical protein
MDRKEADVTDLIRKEVESQKNLITVPYICDRAAHDLNQYISKTKVRKILKHKLGLRWVTVGNEKLYINSFKNISLRKSFTNQMMEILAARKTISSFDETLLQGCSPSAKSWQARGQRAARAYGHQHSGLSLMLAVCSDGKRYI